MTICGRCGKKATGFAKIEGVRYCHGDDPYPTCYMLELWEQAGVPFWLERENRSESAAAESTPEGDLLWKRTRP